MRVDRSQLQWTVKRLVERPAALLVAIATLPVQLLIAIAIKLDSPGPALFIQTRRGRNGKCFRMYKFRSMRWEPGAPTVLNADGSTRVGDDDARLTRFGRWLRSGWDELPQLWNVVRGEMALIGPRPDQPFHLQFYTEEQKRRLTVLPGITGLPQATGRNSLPWRERIARDLYYIDHYSLWLDATIVLCTARALMHGNEHHAEPVGAGVAFAVPEGLRVPSEVSKIRQTEEPLAAGEETPRAQPNGGKLPLSGLHALHIVGGSAFGGGVHVIHRCMEVLRDLGASVALEASDPRVVDFFKIRGYTVHSVTPWVREISPWKDFLYLWRLWAFLRRERFHLVHTHTSKSNFLGRLAACMAGVPTIVAHCHNFYYLTCAPGPRRWFYRALEKFAGRFQQVAIFPEEELAENAVRDGLIAPECAQVIRNAVPHRESLETSAPSSTLGVQDANRFRVCYVGRLAATKGLDILLRAWVMALQENNRLLLLLVGEGEQRARLESLAEELGIQESLQFLGFRKDVAQILACSQAFVLPSHWEGLPIALLEAMSTGLPIVATDIKGVRGTARHGKEALLVPAGNEEELAKALIQISRDKELAESLGQMARKRAREVHSCDRMSESLRQLYLGLRNKQRKAGWAPVLTATLTNCPSGKGPL